MQRIGDVLDRILQELKSNFVGKDLAVFNGDSFYVDIKCFRNGIKRTEVDLLSTDVEKGAEPSAPLINTTDATAIGPSAYVIDTVLPCVHVPQIGNPVISANSIDMIDNPGRPNAVMIKPSQPMEGE
jgi:hypothetical protein